MKMQKILPKYMKGQFIFLASIAIIGSLLFSVSEILPPFIISFAVSYLANPIVTYMEQYGIKRSLGSLITSFVMIGVIFLFLFFSFPFVTKKILLIIKSFKASSVWIDTDIKIMHQINLLMPNVDKEIKLIIAQGIEEVLTMAEGSFDSIGEIALSFFKNFGNFAIMLFVPILMYYITKDWKKIMRNFTLLVPRKHLMIFLRSAKDVDKSVFMYLKGQLKVSSILSIIYASLLYFTPLKFGLILGIMTGIATIVPYFGFGFMSLIIIVTAVQECSGDIITITRTLTALGIGQLLDAGIITPKFMGESINLNPVWMIFGILACGDLFGIIGTFFALPILVIVSALMKNIIHAYRVSIFYRRTVKTVELKTI